MSVGTDLDIEATPSVFSFEAVSWDVTQRSPKSLRDIPKKCNEGGHTIKFLSKTTTRRKLTST